jgi:hypothetical protein
MVGVTESSAHDIVSDLVAAGYVVSDEDPRGNEYRIDRHLPLRDPISRERTVGEVLDLLVGVNAQRNGTARTGSKVADRSPQHSCRHEIAKLTDGPAERAAGRLWVGHSVVG